MKYRLNNVKIIDSRSPWNQQVKDILIADGIIQEAQANDQVDQVIDADGWLIMPGLFETYASIGDPGFEYREDMETVAQAALKGGVTAICAIADNEPVTQHKTHIDYIVKNNLNKLVDIWPMGAVTENLKGKNPTEMFDMHHAGAIAFSDAPHPIKDSGVMMRALQYVVPLNSIIYTVSYDPDLSNDSQVNEGSVSINMGLKGVPHLAEALQVHRDLELLEYTKGKLHISGISTAEGVEQIRKAKAKGLEVTSSVYLQNLLFTDKVVENFDTNYKVVPPLRTAQDQEALMKGLEDGTIDMVSVQHIPLDTESKRLEFEYASPGMANMEFAFALAFQALGDVERVAQLYSIRPREVFNKNISQINEGEQANFILVDPQSTNIVTVLKRKSKSANSPFFGKELKGEVKAVFNNSQVQWNE